MFYEEFEEQKNKTFWGLVEMTSGLVSASFSLPEWQAVKMIFFAPCSSAEGREKREPIFFVIALAPYLGLAVLVFNGITGCAPVFSTPMSS